MLVSRQLTVDRFRRFYRSFRHSRPRGFSSFSTPRRTISSSYSDSKSLVLSSRPADTASIESDVEGALSGSSRRLEYPAATSCPPLPRGTPRDDTDERQSVERRYQSFGLERFFCLRIDSESLDSDISNFRDRNLMIFEHFEDSCI